MIQIEHEPSEASADETADELETAADGEAEPDPCPQGMHWDHGLERCVPD